MKDIKNIYDTEMLQGKNKKGDTWRFLDLSGEKLGVRIEELPPGGKSSIHHFHSLEEEHVIILEGTGTLFLGENKIPLGKGDHACFQAGKEEAHHIENTSDGLLRYLVFGERNTNDVVFYPELEVMMVKSIGNKVFRYAPVSPDKSSENEA